MPPEIVTLGEKELRAKFRALSDDLGSDGIASATLAGGFVVQSHARLDAPVDTGFHRNAISAELKESSKSRAVVDIYFGSHYGIYLEMGTSRMSARPHLRPALTNNVPEIENAAAAALLRFISRYITG